MCLYLMLCKPADKRGHPVIATIKVFFTKELRDSKMARNLQADPIEKDKI